MAASHETDIELHQPSIPYQDEQIEMQKKRKQYITMPCSLVRVGDAIGEHFVYFPDTDGTASFTKMVDIFYQFYILHFFP